MNCAMGMTRPPYKRPPDHRSPEVMPKPATPVGPPVPSTVPDRPSRKDK